MFPVNLTVNLADSCAVQMKMRKNDTLPPISILVIVGRFQTQILGVRKVKDFLQPWGGGGEDFAVFLNK